MTQVALTEIHNKLAEYIYRVRSGESFVLTSRGREMAMLVPCAGGIHATQKEGNKNTRRQAKGARVHAGGDGKEDRSGAGHCQ